MNMQTLILLLIISSLAACSSISDRASKIQVHTQVSSVLDKCKKIGPVTSKTSAFNFDSHQELLRQLREATADLEGDTVVLLHKDATLTTETLQGISYKCY